MTLILSDPFKGTQVLTVGQNPYPTTSGKAKHWNLQNELQLQRLRRKYWKSHGTFFWRTTVSSIFLMAQRTVFYRNADTSWSKVFLKYWNQNEKELEDYFDLITSFTYFFYVYRRMIYNKNLCISLKESFKIIKEKFSVIRYCVTV